MEKAKLGIAYNVLAAIVCLLGYYGGYVITGIFTIAVLFTEENPWLKKYCVKTLLLMLVFSLLYTVLGLIPDILGIVYSGAGIVGFNLYFGAVESVFSMLRQIVDLGEMVLFILMAIFALAKKNFKLPVIEKLVNKCVE
ncbi:MAG: hypothetical protein IJN87_01645 [Firmicutes bacterium]|nr:hypothetical protein [Bacillota bacterium]